MDGRTGFLVGIGSVAVALSVGFIAGYVITMPDEAQKIQPAAFTSPAKSPEEKVIEAKAETTGAAVEPKAPETNSLAAKSVDLLTPAQGIPPTTAPSAAISSASIPAAPIPALVKPAEAAANAAAPPAGPVHVPARAASAPSEERAIEPPRVKEKTVARKPQEQTASAPLPLSPAAPSAAPGAKERTADGLPMSKADIARAIEADIARRQAASGIRPPAPQALRD